MGNVSKITDTSQLSKTTWNTFRAKSSECTDDGYTYMGQAPAGADTKLNGIRFKNSEAPVYVFTNKNNQNDMCFDGLLGAEMFVPKGKNSEILGDRNRFYLEDSSLFIEDGQSNQIVSLGNKSDTVKQSEKSKGKHNRRIELPNNFNYEKKLNELKN